MSESLPVRVTCPACGRHVQIRQTRGCECGHLVRRHATDDEALAAGARVMQRHGKLLEKLGRASTGSPLELTHGRR